MSHTNEAITANIALLAKRLEAARSLSCEALIAARNGDKNLA